MCYSDSVDESLESKGTNSTSIASPVPGMRATAALMIPQTSGTYGMIGDAFLVQGQDRTQPLTVDSNPASQGLLFPIEATKSKGSQREIPTSSSVGYDSLTLTSPPTLTSWYPLTLTPIRENTLDWI